MKKLLLSTAMAFVFLGMQAAHAQDSQTIDRQTTTTTTNSDGSQQTIHEEHHWVRGEHLPQEYSDQQYAVSNWTEYHLHRPDPGYHWVHAQDHYVLVDDNGIVTEIH